MQREEESAVAVWKGENRGAAAIYIAQLLAVLEVLVTRFGMAEKTRVTALAIREVAANNVLYQKILEAMKSGEGLRILLSAGALSTAATGATPDNQSIIVVTATEVIYSLFIIVETARNLKRRYYKQDTDHWLVDGLRFVMSFLGIAISGLLIAANGDIQSLPAKIASVLIFVSFGISQTQGVLADNVSATQTSTSAPNTSGTANPLVSPTAAGVPATGSGAAPTTPAGLTTPGGALALRRSAAAAATGLTFSP